MKTLQNLCLLSLCFAAGCTTVELGDAKVTSFLNNKKMKKLTYSLTDTHGLSRKLTVEGYESDQVQAISAISEAVAKGAAEGAAKSLLPVP